MDENFRNAIVRIQTELKAPKSQYNKFGNYRYRNAEDILSAVKPLLAETGCFLTITDDVKTVGDRFYLTATATLSNGIDSVSVTALAREDPTQKGMTGPQLTGSTSSYARKYALNGLFAIDDSQDIDSLPPQGSHYNNQPVTRDIDREKLLNELKDMGANIQSVLYYYGNKDDVNYSEDTIPLDRLRAAVESKRQQGLKESKENTNADQNKNRYHIREN